MKFNEQTHYKETKLNDSLILFSLSAVVVYLGFTAIICILFGLFALKLSPTFDAPLMLGYSYGSMMGLFPAYCILVSTILPLANTWTIIITAIPLYFEAFPLGSILTLVYVLFSFFYIPFIFYGMVKRTIKSHLWYDYFLAAIFVSLFFLCLLLFFVSLSNCDTGSTSSPGAPTNSWLHKLYNWMNPSKVETYTTREEISVITSEMTRAGKVFYNSCSKLSVDASAALSQGDLDKARLLQAQVETCLDLSEAFRVTAGKVTDASSKIVHTPPPTVAGGISKGFQNATESVIHPMMQLGAEAAAEAVVKRATSIK